MKNHNFKVIVLVCTFILFFLFVSIALIGPDESSPIVFIFYVFLAVYIFGLVAYGIATTKVTEDALLKSKNVKAKVVHKFPSSGITENTITFQFSANVTRTLDTTKETYDSLNVGDLVVLSFRKHKIISLKKLSMDASQRTAQTEKARP